NELSPRSGENYDVYINPFQLRKAARKSEAAATFRDLLRDKHKQLFDLELLRWTLMVKAQNAEPQTAEPQTPDPPPEDLPEPAEFKKMRARASEMLKFILWGSREMNPSNGEEITRLQVILTPSILKLIRGTKEEGVNIHINPFRNSEVIVSADDVQDAVDN